ncbi:medium-chain acyl-CoA ligase ACSF2, mitochondrial [Onthophagus taurus]|uniref:medium-chain acyl-CoA ligase ACSF2, mitochondrial n=1 Tax=Onthophagus taurus TaxID=166361 RepID=UPI0039BE4DD3
MSKVSKIVSYGKIGWRFSSTLSYKHQACEEPLRHISIGTLLEESAKKYRDVPAIISMHQNETLTYGELLKKSDQLAASLQSHGLEIGDRVGVYLPNQYEWVIIMLACCRAGLITVALNPFYETPEMEYCINKVGIKALFTGDKVKQQDYYEIMKNVAPELPNCDPGKLKSKKVPTLKTIIHSTDKENKGTYTFNEILNFSNETQIKNIQKHQHLIDSDLPCNIQFTSGTTGKPKAAVISHFNLANNSYFISKRMELNKKHHKVCVQVPLFHAFGTTITIASAIHFGTTLVFPSLSYNPENNLDALATEKCTIAHGTPTMYVDLINVQSKRKENLSLEVALNGGSPCSPELLRKMIDVLGVKRVKSVYGLTETTGSSFHSLPGESQDLSINTVGHLQEHLEAKIVDEKGNTVPIGKRGELWIRGYSVMLGYWGDEEKTNELITQSKWLKTGDQFVMFENGYGKCVGRIKDMIIRGGENIFPKEIEDLLNTHQNILETQVIGITHERLGEEICACIRLNDEAIDLKLDDVKKFCEGKLAKFKIPTQLKVMKTFPKTTSGKVQKHILRKLIEKEIN